jgi:hypothetical protein
MESQMSTAALARLDDYDFGFLRDKFAEEYPALAHRFDELAGELKRFFELVVTTDGPLAVLSKGVDALWHIFVIHTPQYRAFGDVVNGEYIDHQPHSNATPVPPSAIANFYTEYPKRFGALPKVWLEDIPRDLVPAVSRGEVPGKLLEVKWSGWTGRAHR